MAPKNAVHPPHPPPEGEAPALPALPAPGPGPAAALVGVLGNVCLLDARLRRLLASHPHRQGQHSAPPHPQPELHNS